MASVFNKARKPLGRPPKVRPSRYDAPPPPISSEVIDQTVRDDKGKPAQVLTADGSLVPLSFPGKEMTETQYRSELKLKAIQGGLKSFLKTINVEELKMALAYSDTAKAQGFLMAIIDPANAKFDIATIALHHQIRLADLMELWRNSQHTTALNRIFAGVPKVVGDAVEDARTRLACCGRCDGAGSVQVQREEGHVWITCPNCDGVGKVRKIGDAKSREQILKGSGLIKMDPSMVVNVNNSNTASRVESVIEEIERVGPAIAVSYDAQD